mmetsp:Transcript_37378/g.116169  ORF Transcript_37378/g.116169 Transcript_37378/m.116169 type:complete len:247 (-) Transcript_37378:147-887(-)
MVATGKTRTITLCVLPALVCAGISAEPLCDTEGNDETCVRSLGQSVLQKTSALRERSVSVMEMEDMTVSEVRTKATTAKGVRENCVDVHKACKGWAQQGYCTKSWFAAFMKKNCGKACGFCQTPTPALTPAPTPAPTPVPMKPDAPKAVEVLDATCAGGRFCDGFYVRFSREALPAAYGRPLCWGKDYQVKQLRAGAVIWEGSIRIWVRDVPAGFAQAIRTQGPMPGNWKTGDKFTFDGFSPQCLP